MNERSASREHAFPAPSRGPEAFASRDEAGDALRAWPGGGGRGLTSHIRLTLPRGIHAAGAARRALESIKGQIDPGLFEDVRLLVTELVTNSVRHADAPADDVVELDVVLSDEAVRVEVADGGHGFEPAGEPPASPAASGWGLQLVEQMSDRWGIRRSPRTRVWFEVDKGPRLRRI